MFQTLRTLGSSSHAIFIIAGLIFIFNLVVASAQAGTVKWIEYPHEGVDADADGIRDDVEARIDRGFPQGVQRHWAREIAGAGQRFVVSNGNHFAIHRAHAEMQRAERCLAKQSGELESAKIRSTVLSMLLDTDARREAFQAALTQWEQDVRHRNLPTQPDDHWHEGCGLQARTVAVQKKTKATRARVASEKSASAGLMPAVSVISNLPAPNFFITGEKPEAPKVIRRIPAPAPKPLAPQIKPARKKAPAVMQVEVASSVTVREEAVTAEPEKDRQLQSLQSASIGHTTAIRMNDSQPDTLVETSKPKGLASTGSVSAQSALVQRATRSEPGNEKEPVPASLAPLNMPTAVVMQTPDVTTLTAPQVEMVAQVESPQTGLPPELQDLIRDLVPYIKSFQYD